MLELPEPVPEPELAVQPVERSSLRHCQASPVVRQALVLGPKAIAVVAAGVLESRHPMGSELEPQPVPTVRRRLHYY